MALSASAAFADAILWECRKTIMLRREFISLLAAATASNAPAKSSGKAQWVSLSKVSTCGATFRDDVHAYKSAGFDAIGVWEFKLPDNGSDDQILASLHEANLKVATCVPTVSTILPCAILGKIVGKIGARDPARLVAMICESIFRFARFSIHCPSWSLRDRWAIWIRIPSIG
jgi:hypothetical protein